MLMFAEPRKLFGGCGVGCCIDVIDAGLMLVHRRGEILNVLWLIVEYIALLVKPVGVLAK